MKSVRSWIGLGSSSTSRSVAKKKRKPNIVSTIAVIVCFEVNLLCQAAQGKNEGDYSVANNTAGQKQEEVTDDSVTALLLFLLGVVVLSIGLVCIVRCAIRFAESRPINNEPEAAKGKPKKLAGEDGQNDKFKDIEIDGEIIGGARKDGAISIGVEKHFAKLAQDESKSYQLADDTERRNLKEADGLSQTFGEDQHQQNTGLINGTAAILAKNNGTSSINQQQDSSWTNHPPQQVGAHSVKPIVSGQGELGEGVASNQDIENGRNDQ